MFRRIIPFTFVAIALLFLIARPVFSSIPFEAPTIELLGSPIETFVMADLDGDERDDVVVVNAFGAADKMLTNRSSHYSRPVTYSDGEVERIAATVIDAGGFSQIAVIDLGATVLPRHTIVTSAANLLAVARLPHATSSAPRPRRRSPRAFMPPAPRVSIPTTPGEPRMTSPCALPWPFRSFWPPAPSPREAPAVPRRSRTGWPSTGR